MAVAFYNESGGVTDGFFVGVMWVAVRFLLKIFIGGMMLTGCKPDPDPEDPTTTTHTVVYKIDNHTILMI